MFDIDKIVSYLNRHKDKLSERYRWAAKIDKLEKEGILSPNEVTAIGSIPPSGECNSKCYERELRLKKVLEEKLKCLAKREEEQFDKLCLWIIKDWGGITTANDDDTKLLISNFLERGELGFNRVASYSKVASFMFPEKYIIYDSRVAYTLNWIILSENAGPKYFPIPEGRNSKMAAFDMNVLIRLNHVSKYRPSEIEQLDDRKYISNLDKKLFISPNQAFSELNILIKEVNQKLWEDEAEKQSHLYFTEMLLFSLADREVFLDITKKYEAS